MDSTGLGSAVRGCHTVTCEVSRGCGPPAGLAVRCSDIVFHAFPADRARQRFVFIYVFKSWRSPSRHTGKAVPIKERSSLRH